MQLKARPSVGTLTWYIVPALITIDMYISVVFTLPALLQPLCTQFGRTVAVAIVTLLACSCKLLHCGVPGCSCCILRCMYVLLLWWAAKLRHNTQNFQIISLQQPEPNSKMTSCQILLFSFYIILVLKSTCTSIWVTRSLLKRPAIATNLPFKNLELGLQYTVQ